MNEKERIEIKDRERRSQTEYTDKLPKAHTQVESREDTVRNIEDEPHPKAPDEPS